MLRSVRECLAKCDDVSEDDDDMACEENCRRMNGEWGEQFSTHSSTDKHKKKLWVNLSFSPAPPTWSRLRIQNLNVSDAGDYICRAKNTGGQKEMRANLEVVMI